MKILSRVVLSFLFASVSYSLSAQQPFEHYKTRIYKGPLAKLVFAHNPVGKMYRTIITDTYYYKPYMVKGRKRTGMNFAGHYCFVWWGCGSNCQNSAIVDTKTGIIYPGVTAALGYKFERDSRLLVINPGSTANDCAFCEQQFWVWEEHTKSFFHLRK